MRLSGFFYPAEVALCIYLILTGILLSFHHSLVPHANALLTFRIVVVLFIMLLALIQPAGRYVRALAFFRFMFPLVMLAYLYAETDLLNNFLFSENLDPFFSHLEESVFGFQPSLVFAELIPSEIFAEIMYFGYFSYYLMLVIVPVYIYRKDGEDKANRVMFIMIHSFFVFYLFFILVPVAGPQFYFTDWPSLPDGFLFGNLMRWIQELGEAPTAAFPSSHVSICIMLIMLSHRYAKEILKFIIPVAFLLVLSTVYIRAHYLIDVLAAFVITWPLYRFSGFIYDRIYLKPEL